MTYLIIGGGIAGLYTAYCLYERFGISDITIIEKNDRLGGRIETLFINDTPIEMGAGGFLDNQKCAMALLEKLNLTDQMVHSREYRKYADLVTVQTNTYDKQHSQNVPTFYQIKQITDINDTDFNHIMNSLVEKIENPSFNKMIFGHTLYGVIEKIYGYEKAKKMLHIYGYEGDLTQKIVSDEIKYISKINNSSVKYYCLKHGMHQIIDRLEKYVTSVGIKIIKNCECLDIHKNGNHYECITNQDTIASENVIFAIPRHNIIQIKYLHDLKPKLKKVLNKRLMKIFLQFPLINGKSWFDDITGILTSSTMISQILPVDKQNGIMLVYCDETNAYLWHCLHKTGNLENEIFYFLTKMFMDREIPKPTKMIVKYHKAGTHMWKPYVDNIKLREEIAKPYEHEKIYIVGESYSLYQQWCEGALESVEHLMDLLVNNQ